MIKIGNVEIENPVVIAPMAGISNIAFRRIAKRFGAGLVCNEMVSDKALYYDSLVMILIRLCMQLNIWIHKQIVTLLTLIWGVR